METKITKAMVLGYIASMVDGVVVTDEQAAAITAYVEKEKASLAKRAESAKAYAAKRRAKAAEASDELADNIAAVLADTTPDDAMTVADIVAQLAADYSIETSTQKVVYRLGKMVKSGTLGKNESKTVKGVRTGCTYFTIHESLMPADAE